MRAAGLDVAVLNAMELLGGAMEAIPSGLWLEPGGFDGGLHGSAHLRNRQDSPPPATGPSAIRFSRSLASSK